MSERNVHQYMVVHKYWVSLDEDGDHGFESYEDAKEYALKRVKNNPDEEKYIIKVMKRVHVPKPEVQWDQIVTEEVV